MRGLNTQDKLAAVFSGPWGWRLVCIMIAIDALIAAFLAYRIGGAQ